MIKELNQENRKLQQQLLELLEREHQMLEDMNERNQVSLDLLKAVIDYKMKSESEKEQS